MSSRILIIEDETSIAELEKDYLELSWFEVELEEQGDVGLERALNEDFDLLILDLMLPGMDGFEICRRGPDSQNGDQPVSEVWRYSQYPLRDGSRVLATGRKRSCVRRRV